MVNKIIHYEQTLANLAIILCICLIGVMLYLGITQMANDLQLNSHPQQQNCAADEIILKTLENFVNL